METYSIISSSTSACCAHHSYPLRHPQSLPAEPIQMNYPQSHDRSHISSTSAPSHGALQAKSMVAALNSSGDYSAITWENNSSLKMDAGGDIMDHRRNGHRKRVALGVEDEEEEEEDDEEGRNNNGSVCGGKKKKEREKKVRRPRFAFQTRSQVDILDDGYRWRKYGQKAVKNNHFPRSYYRCTHQGCHVKKQVQRLSKDEEVVVTTYEGIHTHPIERNNDNFEQILNQMQIYNRF